MPKGLELNRHVMRQSDFITLSVHNLIARAARRGDLRRHHPVLFLLDVRTTLITLTALPLSLAVAFLVLWALGLSINVMTLGGLAVAIGELVDDAIIDVENVFRRLRENAALPAGDRRRCTGSSGTPATRSAARSSSRRVIICMVFVPLLFLQGSRAASSGRSASPTSCRRSRR
jgi:Cu/Ag efflux pump CusA